MKHYRKASQGLLYRLSENLKRLRAARGCTQQELAAITGLSKTYISNVEQATVNITLDNLETLAEGLNCSAEDLLLKTPA